MQDWREGRGEQEAQLARTSGVCHVSDSGSFPRSSFSATVNYGMVAHRNVQHHGMKTLTPMPAPRRCHAEPRVHASATRCKGCTTAYMTVRMEQSAPGFIGMGVAREEGGGKPEAEARAHPLFIDGLRWLRCVIKPGWRR